MTLPKTGIFCLFCFGQCVWTVRMKIFWTNLQWPQTEFCYVNVFWLRLVTGWDRLRLMSLNNFERICWSALLLILASMTIISSKWAAAGYSCVWQDFKRTLLFVVISFFTKCVVNIVRCQDALTNTCTHARARTHTHTTARTHARTHTHTHTHSYKHTHILD